MTTVNIHEAKTKLSRLIADVENGEEVVIARAGKPVVRLVPVKEKTRRRTPGSMKHLIGEVPDDALAPMQDADLKEWGLL